MGVQEALAMLVSVILLSVCTTIYATSYSIDKMNPDVGFDSRVEKTAQTTDTEVVPVLRTLKLEDVVLMFSLLGEHTPGPDKVELSVYNKSNSAKVSTETFELTEDFLNHRAGAIINILSAQSSALPPDHYVKYTTVTDTNGMVRWEFQIWK